MKKALIYFICLLTIKTSSFGQTSDTTINKNSKEVEVNLSIINTKILSQQFYGINWKIKYFPTDRLGTGVYITVFQKKISDTFTYSIKEPVIDFYEFGWTNQYNFFKTNGVQAGINLINALSMSRLGDNAVKEKYHKYMSKEVSTNYYYTLQPGAYFAFKLISTKQNGGIWLTAETNYRFVFGKSKYAATKQFSGYSFGIGISVKHSTD